MKLDIKLPPDEAKLMRGVTKEVEFGDATSPLRGRIIDLWFEHIDLFRRAHAEKCKGGEKWDRSRREEEWR